MSESRDASSKVTRADPAARVGADRVEEHDGRQRVSDMVGIAARDSRRRARPLATRSVVGDGVNWWTATHHSDVTKLMRQALEEAPANSGFRWSLGDWRSLATTSPIWGFSGWTVGPRRWPPGYSSAGNPVGRPSSRMSRRGTTPAEEFPAHPDHRASGRCAVRLAVVGLAPVLAARSVGAK